MPMPSEVQTAASTTPTPEFLSRFGEGLANSAEPVPDGSVPEGNYTAEFVGVETATSRSGGDYINILLKILGPGEELAGTPLKAHFNLINMQNFEIFKKTLRRLGIRTDDPEEVLDAMRERIGTVWNVTVRHKMGFSNVFFNQPVSID